MSNGYLENDILDLKLNKNIVQTLKNNSIFKIKDLWVKKRSNLKEIGLSDSQIKEIIIKLELIGLDLNKKRNK